MKGINIKTVKTKYGDIIKLGIYKESLLENEFNNGWLNIDLKKNRDDEWYAEVSNYKKEG
jgi:hypothetical protein